jgi:hypothetical protein
VLKWPASSIDIEKLKKEQIPKVLRESQLAISPVHFESIVNQIIIGLPESLA